MLSCTASQPGLAWPDIEIPAQLSQERGFNLFLVSSSDDLSMRDSFLTNTARGLPARVAERA